MITKLTFSFKLDSFCHILLFDIDNVIVCAASLSLVVNSTFKFFIYVSVSPGIQPRMNLGNAMTAVLERFEPTTS